MGRLVVGRGPFDEGDWRVESYLATEPEREFFRMPDRIANSIDELRAHLSSATDELINAFRTTKEFEAAVKSSDV